jgi:flavorubredoxin
MTITNKQSGTNVHEIADGIYRINTPVIVDGVAGGFSFNQYLIVDDEPLIFHTGPRKMFSLVQEAVASVLPVARLRYIAFSHVEARMSADHSTNGLRQLRNPRRYAAQ